MYPHQLNEITTGTSSIVSPGHPTRNGRDYLPNSIRNTADPIPQKPIAIDVPLSNKRIISQQGCFTVHGQENHSIDKYFEDVESPRIAKFEIHEKNRSKLLNSLYLAGYKEDNVYQDLNALSKRIIREWLSDD